MIMRPTSVKQMTSRNNIWLMIGMLPDSASVISKKTSVWVEKRVVDWERRTRRMRDQPKRPVKLATVKMNSGSMVSEG